MTARKNCLLNFSTEYHLLDLFSFLASFKRCRETFSKFTKQLSVLVKIRFVTSLSLLCSCAGTCQNLAKSIFIAILTYKSPFITRFQVRSSLVLSEHGKLEMFCHVRSYFVMLPIKSEQRGIR